MSTKAKIAVVDYGVGNLYSVIKALKLFNDNFFVTEEAADLRQAQAIILPGVGSFGAGVEGLKKRNLITALKQEAVANKPMLGICLGAQLMLTTGHEFGVWPGLNLIKGQVVKFPNLGKNVKIPHVGWNKIYPPKNKQWSKTILQGLPAESNVYFVHSFILQPQQTSNILALANYEGYEFCAAVRQGNIYGCQFHPEKSGTLGQKIIQNFINLI